MKKDTQKLVIITVAFIAAIAYFANIGGIQYAFLQPNHVYPFSPLFTTTVAGQCGNLDARGNEANIAIRNPDNYPLKAASAVIHKPNGQNSDVSVRIETGIGECEIYGSTCQSGLVNDLVVFYPADTGHIDGICDVTYNIVFEIPSQQNNTNTCPTDYVPVCGIDGLTYTNSCTAALAGINIQMSGPCPSGNNGNQSNNGTAIGIIILAAVAVVLGYAALKVRNK